MPKTSRLLWLVIRELRSASRSKYLVISFVLLPILMWVLQALSFGFFSFTFSTSQGLVLYYANQDHTPSGIDQTNKSLGDIFIETLNQRTKANESLVYNVELKSIDANEGFTKIKRGEISFFLYIQENFTTLWKSWNDITDPTPQLYFFYSPAESLRYIRFTTEFQQILQQPPFTQIQLNITKQTTIYSEQVKIEGKQEFNFGVGIFSLMAIIIGVMAPAPFVSASFAGEREKKTLESLIALPLTRKSILMGKLLAGLILCGIFAIFNIVGIFAYGALIRYFVTASNNNANAVPEENLQFIGAIRPEDIILLVFISLSMLLTAFIAISIGVSLASLTREVRTAESMYSILMLLPAMIIGFVGMFAGIPEKIGTLGWLLYIIPFTHTMALLNKVLYFPAAPWEYLFHISYLIFSTAAILFVASKMFDREGLLN